MMQTMADIMKCEMMPICSCNREKAIYFCKTMNCPNNCSQPYYCMLCADEEEEKHSHPQTRMNREI